MLEINEDILDHLVENNETLTDAIAQQVKQFDTQNLPAIISLKVLAHVVNITTETLTAMCFSTDKFYRHFFIPKKNGGERRIDVPFPSLYLIQEWIRDYILKKLEVDTDAACAYIKNKSIKDHVSKHKDSPYLLKMDIKDFFPSIKNQRVFHIFKDLGYSKELSTIFTHLLTLDGAIPQGAPSSPVLSNIVATKLDRSLKKYCLRNQLFYSRYADDLVFSGNKIDKDDIEFFIRILKLEGFSPNKEKTHLYKPERTVRHLTGLVINNNEIRIPKRTRRFIRQKMHYMNKYFISDIDGFKDQNVVFIDPLTIERLIGYVNFWLWIEPESEYPIHYIEQLKNIKKEIYQYVD